MEALWNIENADVINGAINHVEKTWSHVLHGNSSVGEKLEFGVEGIIGTAVAVGAARLGLSRYVEKTLTAAKGALPGLEVGSLRSAENAAAITVGKAHPLEVASALSNESRFLGTSKLVPVAPPQLRYTAEFAQGMFDAFKKGSGAGSEEVLENISAAANDFRLRRFPYVPPINQELSGAYGGAYASATRNLIKWHGTFSENANGQLLFRNELGRELSAGGIAGNAAHELAHTEQTAIKIWRQADQLGIGAKATPEQTQELLRLNKTEHDWDKSADAPWNQPGVSPADSKALWPFQSVVEHVIETRNGQHLSADDAIRADKLIDIAAKKGQILECLFKFKDVKEKATGFIKDVDPKTPEDFAAFYHRVQASKPDSIPVGLRDYVARVNEMRRQSTHVQAIPDSQVGQSFYVVFKNHAKAVDLTGRLLAYRPYQNMFHEKEAFLVGDAVEASYSSLTGQ